MLTYQGEVNQNFKNQLQIGYNEIKDRIDQNVEFQQRFNRAIT